MIAAIFYKVLSQPNRNDPNFVFPLITTHKGAPVVAIVDKRKVGEIVNNVGEARKGCRKTHKAILATPMSVLTVKEIAKAFNQAKNSKL